MSLSQGLSEWGFLLGCLHGGITLLAWDALAANPSDGNLATVMVGVAVMMTAVLAYSLAVHAHDSGYSRAWCLMAALGLIGVVVVHFLPDRSGRHIPGFPIDFPGRQP